MATPTPIQERFQVVLKEAQELGTKSGLTSEEAIKLEELLNEGDQLKAQIGQASRLSGLSDFAGASAGAGAPPLAPGGATVLPLTPAGHTDVQFGETRDRDGRRSKTMEMLGQYGEGIYDPKTHALTSTDDYRDSFKSYIRNGLSGIKGSEYKTLQEGTDSQGGFLVPSDLLEKVIAREPTPTRVAGRTMQLQTSRDTLVIPKVNYTADDLYTTGMRVTWTGEIPSSSTAMRVTEPVFGQARIPVYTAMMSIPVTNDMIEDSAFPLISFLSAKFGETVDLLRDNIILNGSGQGQPQGILVNPGVGVDNPATTVSTASGLLDADTLIALGFSLPEQYDDNAVFVMNKVSTALKVAQLRDSPTAGTGRYLWGSGLQDSGLAVNMHDRVLLGYPVILSGFMPNVAASAFPIIFGDLGGYYLVNRVGFSIQVLRELYAETNQILLLGRVRFGGQIAEPWRMKVYQVHS